MRRITRSLLISLISICFVYEVRAEVVIEIKIPDEIKCCTCGCKEKKGYPQRLGIQPQEPRDTHIGDTEALQKIAIAEAGDTDIYTMAYVMQTVLNRVGSDDFPGTVEGVVKQKGQFSTYPSKYVKAVPNDLSKAALDILPELDNKDQLYFENTVKGSWQSTHLQWVFDYNTLSFYK